LGNDFTGLAIEANQANPAILGECRNGHSQVVDMVVGRAEGKGRTGNLLNRTEKLEIHLNFFDQFNGHAELSIFEQAAKRFAIDQINRCHLSSLHDAHLM
jgi:hypothetical protein